MSSQYDFKPVRPRLLYEDAASQIRRAIAAGMYSPGARLGEVELARSLSLSRGPVREALRVLEQEGIVISEAQRGARVAHVSQREALDALCLREVIETLAVREAVQRATVEDIDDLSAHIVAMREAEQAQNLPEVVELDRRFHERFLEIASSETARIAWRSIAGRIQLYQALGNSVWIQSESVAEAHQPIVDALKSRRPEVLRRAITYHIDQTRSSLENLQL